MGGLRYDFETKITPDTLSSSNIMQLSASYRTISKRESDAFPGLSKTVGTCHTCGRAGHNRYDCRNFMNPHCNNTCCTWSQSSIATEFRRIGHDQFVPNVLLNGEMTRTTNNPGAATYVYPIDDVENDMGPAAKKYPRKTNNNNNKNTNKKANHNNNNRNNDRSNRDNDRKDNRDNDRKDNRDTDRNKNRDTRDIKDRGYKGKRESKIPYAKNISENRILSNMQMLLSTIIPNEINDYL